MGSELIIVQGAIKAATLRDLAVPNKLEQYLDAIPKQVVGRLSLLSTYYS